jgi:hypothetical protein
VCVTKFYWKNFMFVLWYSTCMLIISERSDHHKSALWFKLRFNNNFSVTCICVVTKYTLVCMCTEEFEVSAIAVIGSHHNFPQVMAWLFYLYRFLRVHSKEFCSLSLLEPIKATDHIKVWSNNSPSFPWVAQFSFSVTFVRQTLIWIFNPLNPMGYYMYHPL